MTIKEFYFSGDVAAVLAIDPVLLRRWRERGICGYGYTELIDGEENSRARRRYTATEICQMAIAMALSTKGYGLESTFGFAAGDDVVAAIERVREDREEEFLMIVGLVDHGVANNEHLVVIGKHALADRVSQAAAAIDPLTGRTYDFVEIYNISAMARRTMAAILALD